MEEFEGSGLTRREYCERHGIAVTTLDGWRRGPKGKARFVEVAVAAQASGPGFALVLTNGRRIESSWKFAEAELARLIQAAEG